jgi:hypothetical protein
MHAAAHKSKPQATHQHSAAAPAFASAASLPALLTSALHVWPAHCDATPSRGHPHCSPCSCSIPQLLLDNVFKAPQDGLALQAYISACNTLFLFVAVCVAYGAVSGCVLSSAQVLAVTHAIPCQLLNEQRQVPAMHAADCEL